MRMELGLIVSYGLIVVGLVLLVVALRLRGCVSFGVWVVLGMAIAWYVLRVVLHYPFAFPL